MPHFRQDEATPHEVFRVASQEEIDAETDAIVSRAIPWILEPPKRRHAKIRNRSVHGKRAVRWTAAAALTAGAVAGTMGAANALGGWPSDNAPESRLVPTPGVGASASRLMPEVKPSVASTAFALAHSDVAGQEAVGYDPCRPIQYVIRAEGAPAGAPEILERSAARVSAATGLVFEFAGMTDEVPASDRQAYQPDRYGDKWAPVLVSWGADGSSGGSPVISTGSAAMQIEDSAFTYVTGQVSLNGLLLAEWAAEPGGEEFVDAAVMRELARLVGLAVVDDPAQLLHSQPEVDRLDFGAGDLAGLALVGSGECAPQL